jgi:hypothetical protein
MRSSRSLSIPLSLVLTFCVWFAFLWTMQHAPVSRRTGSGEDFGARSSGGLANNFATAVVKFFDNQDPRAVEEGAAPTEPVFDAEMVEYLPLPKLDRKELAKDLPEVFANLSLTPRNLYRSDVDLDGDRDLDLALLVRISKTEALGAVLEYVGDEKFRFAGKFPCRYARAEDFPRCFQVLLTGAGKMHLLSRTLELGEGTGNAEAEALVGGDRAVPEKARRAGWRWLRLEDGALVKVGEFEDPVCAPTGSQPGRKARVRAEQRAAGRMVEADVQPVRETNQDWIRFVARCGEEPLCKVFGLDPGAKEARPIANPPEAACVP